MTRPNLFTELTIPVNPDYDWNIDPEDQPEYVNPVRLNQQVIRLANAATTLAAAIVKTNRRVVELKQVLAEAEAELDDFENVLMSQHPPQPADRKTLKLLAAYIRSTVQEMGLYEEWQSLQTRSRNARRDLEKELVEVENLRQVYAIIKLQGEHIQTHLSFVKNEMFYSRR